MSDDARPSYHPALIGREQPMLQLADTVRQLVDLTVTNAAPPEVLDAVVRELRAVTDTLAAHVPAQALPRFIDPADVGASDASMDDSMPYDPVVGRYNPLALPVAITFEPPLAIGTGCFTTPYEGGPGWVHGAAIAATFDIVLTAANHLAGAAGPTVWLTVRFRRPTLVGVDARFEAEVVARDARRVTSRGRLVQDGMVCVEAEGEFAVIEARRLRREKPGTERSRRAPGGDG